MNLKSQIQPQRKFTAVKAFKKKSQKK